MTENEVICAWASGTLLFGAFPEVPELRGIPEDARVVLRMGQDAPVYAFIRRNNFTSRHFVTNGGDHWQIEPKPIEWDTRVIE